MEIGGLMGICFWDIEGISKRDDTTVMFGVVRKWKNPSNGNLDSEYLLNYQKLGNQIFRPNHLSITSRNGAYFRDQTSEDETHQGHHI